jgi:hypothetical protein
MGIVPSTVRVSKNALSVDILMPDHLESVSISNRKVSNWLVLPKHPNFEPSNNLLLAYGNHEEAQSAICKNISNPGFASLQFRPIPNRVSAQKDAAFEAWYLVGVMALVFLLTMSVVLLMRAENYRKLSGMIEEQTRELSKTAFPEKTRVREFDRELESANRSAQDLLAKLGEIGLQQPVAITLQRFLATCPELPSIRYSEIRFSNDTVMIFGDSDDLSSVRLLIDDLRRQNVAVKEEQYGNKFELRIQFPPDNNEVSNTVRM